MPTVTRLTSNGVFQSLGGFDEVSLNSGSIKFSGTDWLTLANTAALQIPTADFTVEMFVYCNTFVATGQGQILLGKGLAGFGTYEYNFLLSNSSGNMFLQFGYSTTGSNQIFLNSSTIPITLNSWNHLAYTRTGTNLTFWFNGVSYGTFTVPSTMFTSSGLISIASNSTGTYNPLNGYISNLRLVVGTNLYTSNFRPPTSPLLPIANTALLLSVDPQNPFGDSSVNNLTITKNGNPQFNTLGPFYYPANTSINLANTNNNPALGSNTNIITSTTSNGVVMVSGEFDEVSMSLGNTKQKVLNTGTMMVGRYDEVAQGSLKFDGSTGYLSVPYSSNFEFGNKDFTIEFWIYAQEDPTGFGVMAFPHNTDNYAQILFYGSTSSLIVFSSSDGTSWDVSTGSLGSLNITVRAWNHIAVSKSGSSIRCFVDGKLQNIIPFAGTFTGTYDRCWIGDTVSNSNYNGLLSNIRIVNGTALYTANFAPPQMVLSSVANTVLLLNTTTLNPFVDSSNFNNNITVNGGVTSNTFAPFI